MIIKKIVASLAKTFHDLDLFLKYGPKDKPETETFTCGYSGTGRGSLVTELPAGLPLQSGVSLEEIEADEKAKVAEAERIAREDALELQRTIIAWQKLAGVEPEKTLDLLIPIKEGKVERRRSTNFKSTQDMVAFLQDKGFVPYDLEYIEEARTGKYRFIRIKKTEVKNFFEFPDAKFNGPEFYTPYRADFSHPVSFGPYLASHQFVYPEAITAEQVLAKEGKLSVLAPLAEHAYEWKNEDGVFTPKTEIDYFKEALEKPAKDWLADITGIPTADRVKKKK